MKELFTIPESKKIRLIINTDAKNEADDQFALVQALLSPRLLIKDIAAAHFGTHRTEHSMEESFAEVVKLLELMDLQDEVSVSKGAAKALPDTLTPQPSEAADKIIAEAMTSADERPLFVIFLGPITDLATAYLQEPAIADKLTAIWIGCGAWPDGETEFNLGNDIHAANVVFQSSIPLWIVPRDVYSTMRVSIAELAVKVRPYGRVGRYLFDQLVEFNHRLAHVPPWPKGEMWSLGDSPAVSLLLDDHEYSYTMRPAPHVNPDMSYAHVQTERLLRWYHYVDRTFTLEDLYAKLQLHYG